MNDSAPDTRLAVLLDRLEIEDLIKRYARAIDLRDYELLDSCFIPDAWLDFSKVGGAQGPYPEVRAWLQEVLAPLAELQHFVSNIELRIERDEASGSCYTLNLNRMPASAGGAHVIVGAIYRDRFERTRAGWRIAARAEERLFLMDES